MPNLYVALLHEGMWDKAGNTVTTSLTMIDLHDIARSARTYSVQRTFICHPSDAIRKLARTLKSHWEDGFGSTYNPKRRIALMQVEVVRHLDEALLLIENETGQPATVVGTSAHQGDDRISFREFRSALHQSDNPYLLVFGTGWGMGPQLLERCDLMLEPLKGPEPYNHLSVRSACAICLDKLMGVSQ